MKKLARKLFKSKTLFFSYALVGLGVVEQNYSLLRDSIPPDYQGLVFVAIAVVVALLRLATTKPLGDK